MNRLTTACTLAALAFVALAARADNIAESVDFLTDTRDYGGSVVAESGDFTVVTVTESGSGGTESVLFTVDTRAVDVGRGMVEGGDFTINTLGTGTPLALAGVTFSAASTGAGTMRWTITVPPERAGAVPVFQISLNGGATWLPVTGLTPPGALLAGANLRAWNYRAMLPANTLTPNPLLRVTLNGITGDYALPPVDTRPVTLASGRVLDSATGLPLAGVAVNAGPASAMSDGQGRFVLSNPGESLTVSRNGYETNTAPTLATGRTDARQLVVPDVRLSGASATQPVVIEFKKDHAGLVLPFNAAASACAVELSGKVDWKGRPPGTVRLRHPGGWSFPATVLPAAGGKSGFTAALDEKSYQLWNNLSERSPDVLVQATAGDGTQSNLIPLKLKAIRIPTWMKTSLELGVLTVEADCKTFSADLEIPSDAKKFSRGFGLLGNFVYEPQFTAGFDLDYGSGEWEFSLGAQQKRGFRPRLGKGPRIKWDRAEITSSVSGKITGRVKETPGGFPLLVDGGGLQAEIEGRYDIVYLSLLDVLVAPGTTSTLVNLPGAKRFLKPLVSTVFAKGKAEIEATLRNATQGDLSVEAEGKLVFGPGADLINIDSKYSPILLRATVGGDFKFMAAYPARTYSGDFECYAEFEYGSFGSVSKKEQFIIYQTQFFDTAGNARNAARSLAGGRQLQFVPVKATPRAALRQAEQPDYESFLAGADVYNATAARFARLARPSRARDGGGARAQVDLPLLGNVYRDSAPALAARGAELLMVYVRDNGAGSAQNSTDLSWMYFDGAAWTAPQPLTADGLPETGPQLAFDGSGNVVACWTRIKQPVTGATTPEQALAGMEIVTATWNRTTRTWSAPVALTANAYLDLEPQLAGPLADGRVLLTWKSNLAGELTGTAAANSRLHFAEWSAATQSWSAPAILDTTLRDYGPFSFSAAGSSAVLAWNEDADHDEQTPDDEDIFYRTWNGGAWSAVTRLTTDEISDGAPLAVATTTGAHFLLWGRAGTVMMSENGAPPQPAAGEGWETFASQSTSVAAGADGRLAVVWPRTSPQGHDLAARVYDPQQHTWSDDIPVTADSEAEHQPQAVWDSTGNLTVLYKKAPVTLVTRTVTLPEGGTLQVENVPELGATRLMVSKVPLATDLSLSALTARALSNNWLPGTPVELSVTLENCGHLAVQDVVIGFYDGDPAAGGVKIGEDIIAGLFAGKAKAAPGFSWVMPALAAAHTVFARMDGFTPAAGGVAVERSDANAANNTASTLIGGVDYRVRVLDYSLSESAAVRAVVEVTNAGPSLVQPGTLELRSLSQPLASVPVPVLAAGEVAEVIIESPAGTQPEGERTYEVCAESGDAALDITPEDNRAAFTAKLWLDADEDGLPDGWEAQYGLSPTGNDAALDTDGDGANNLLEYALGTSPVDALSLPEKGFDVTMSADGAGFVFTYHRRSTSPYPATVETSPDLSRWGARVHEDELLSTNGDVETRRVTISVGTDLKQFFRLRVSAD